ncbi:pyrimidine 5'-nucleotidase [Terasakiella brassicae]|uniref:Pyrimidine 5'-nucleotidase n=2 Tax=Terasakiella brassicae TaxID=1634917 RepID=A0A917BP10_9PROT|nr:pyrimidine 5'-nucleotidase [Terasakiella brassicae]
MIMNDKISAWVFDLDNTLYPASANVFAQVDVKMREYVAQFLKIDQDEAHRIQKSYFREYGTTLRGMMTHHGMDPSPFLNYVHNIDVDMVAPSPALSDVLGELSGKKYIFTNASTGHAERILARLGIAQHFDGIFDIVDAGYQPKPNPEIYDLFVEKFQVDPQTSIMVEDIARNLAPAAALGMQCLWIKTDTKWGKDGAGEPYVHYETDDLVAWLQGAV